MGLRAMIARGLFRDLRLLALIVAIGVGVFGYLVTQQGMRLPIIEEGQYRLKAEMTTAQAVIPGQGQTVRVAGVRIGDIGQVELEDGRATVELLIDPEFEDVIRTDATALLRPKTGLKDMFLEVDPGTRGAPQAKEGWRMPVRNTLPDVNPDEILAGLDVDVRDHVKLLLGGASRGLDGRGEDLREVLKRFEPTHRSLAKVGTAVRGRRVELRRLVTSLARLNEELADNDQDLTEVVGESATVFRALASRQDGLKATVNKLPGALRDVRLALDEADKLGRALVPATTKLRPVPVALKRANEATTPFAKEAMPLLRDDIRPFVREARPLVRELRPAARDLAAAEPGTTRSLNVLNNLVNMLAYNPRGAEGPDVAGRDEGYLYHFGWLGHQSTNLFSSTDANGVFRPILVTGVCSTLRATLAASPLAELANGLSGVLTDPAICGTDPVASK